MSWYGELGIVQGSPRLIPFNKKNPKKWYGLDIHTGEGKLGKSEDIQLFHYSFYRHYPRWATQIPLLQFPQEVLGFLRVQAQGLQFSLADGKVREGFTGEQHWGYLKGNRCSKEYKASVFTFRKTSVALKDMFI